VRTAHQRFFEAIDTRNDAHLDNLFADDATYARPTDPNTVMSGRETIRKAFESRPGGRVTRHTCSNVRITVESAERATGYHRVVLSQAGPASAHRSSASRPKRASSSASSTTCS
jgi:ketosteroid isomerase-like protein